MLEYVVQDYQKGFEKDQVRIGIEVARNWIWPYASLVTTRSVVTPSRALRALAGVILLCGFLLQKGQEK